MTQMKQWKDSPFRKPLILKGVRQSGKTCLLKEFGKLHYENTVYFNFDEQSELAQFFEGTKDVKRILENLSFAHGSPIHEQKTLIIFDEIQESIAALNSLI